MQIISGISIVDTWLISYLKCVTFKPVLMPTIFHSSGILLVHDNTWILPSTFCAAISTVFILIWETKLSPSDPMYLLIALFTPQLWQYMTIIRDILWTRPLIFADKFLGNGDQFKIIWENCNRDYYLCAQSIDSSCSAATVRDTE